MNKEIEYDPETKGKSLPEKNLVKRSDSKDATIGDVACLTLTEVVKSEEELSHSNKTSINNIKLRYEDHLK